MNQKERRAALQSLYDQMEEEARYQASKSDYANLEGLSASIVRTQMLGVRLAAAEIGIDLDQSPDRVLT